jgi:hypothetical protein
MKLNRDARPGGPIVTGFAAGGFKVEDQVYRALLLTPERFAEWAPPPSWLVSMASISVWTSGGAC